MSDADRIREMLKRQRMLADVGEFALTCQNLDEVLGTGRAKVLEIHHAGECLFVRAGVGRGPGVVGQLNSPSAFAAGLRSSCSFWFRPGPAGC